MTDQEYHPSSLDRRLDEKAYKSFMPEPIPWLGLALGAAFGVLFAYALQESAPDALALLVHQTQRTFVLALSSTTMD
jgi:hypothetical protein